MYEPKQTPQARTANFQAWEDAAARDKQTHRERVASEVFLAALGSTENFREKIILKGGVLVGAVYESGRNTADLDFSTTLEPSMDFLKKLEAELIAALPSAAALVGSPDTIIKVQSVKYRPRPDTFIDADAPAIEVKFAFAERFEPWIIERSTFCILLDGNLYWLFRYDLPYTAPKSSFDR